MARNTMNRTNTVRCAVCQLYFPSHDALYQHSAVRHGRRAVQEHPNLQQRPKGVSDDELFGTRKPRS